MSSDNIKSVKRSTWRWWQSNKIPDNNKDCASSIAPSSLVVHHSIHSKESIEILSTASIKSKPWISQKLKNTSVSPTQEDEDNTMELLSPENKSETNSRHLKINNTPSSSSFLNDVPSITSSTIPVVNFNPNERSNNKRSLDATVFSGIKAKFGKWVNKDRQV